MERGANELLDFLTDPVAWSASGEVDFDERWIAWTSVRFGLDAITSIGRNWGSRESFWAAVRALGTLQGIWEGPRAHTVRLTSLLDPRIVRAHVVGRLPDRHLDQWAAGVIDNYEAALKQAFPGKTLDQLLPAFQEVRNLVHGVGVQGRSRPRNARLETLRALADSSADVQLLIDIAVMWWTVTILNPRVMCASGFVP